MKKRNITYTIQVPIQITMVAENTLTPEELEERVDKEVCKRLLDGRFDVFTSDFTIKHQRPHFTAEEIKEQDRLWEEIFKKVNDSGRKNND